MHKFESYLDVLVSLHKERRGSVKWEQVADASPPPAPTPEGLAEVQARHDLGAYQPGVFDRMFGTARRRSTALHTALLRAQHQDRAEFSALTQRYEAAYALWEYRRRLARRMLAKDVSGYAEALQHAGAFDELASLQMNVAITDAESSAVVLTCRAHANSQVPTEEIKLTASGKVSARVMATSRYWALYQDFVCSSALRAALETLATLPVDRVIVNVGAVQTNTSTGHPEFLTQLAVHIARAALLRINLSETDASDAMRNFNTE